MPAHVEARLSGPKYRRLEQLTELLYRPEPRKAAAVPLLVRATEVAEAERAGFVWTEDSDVSRVFTFLVFDRYSRRPRRRFSHEDLVDLTAYADVRRVPRSVGLWLTTDGIREWFLVLDAGFRPLRLDDRATHALSSVTRELAELLGEADDEDPSFFAAGDPPNGGFPGLSALAAHEVDEPERVRARFELIRLLDELSDRAFLADPADVRGALSRVKEDAARLPTDDLERRLLLQVVEAAGSLKLEPLLVALPGLAGHLEDRGRLEAAESLHRMAYRAAAEYGAHERASGAARRTARSLRKRAEWEASRAWYGLAFDLADSLGDPAGMSLALQGQASIHRDRGNLPKARETLGHVLRLAVGSGSRQAIAHAHHELAAVSHVSGSHVEAAHHAWEAVRHYEDEADIVRALVDLAESCRGAGDLEAAEMGFRVVVARAGDTEALAHALGTLTEIAALKGDREALACWVRRFEQSRQDIPVRAVVRFLFDLGQAWGGLRETARATEVFQQVIELSEAHGFAQLVFEAEGAILGLASGRAGEAGLPEPPSTLREVREGLARLEASLT